MARWNHTRVQLLWWAAGVGIVAVVAFALYSLVGALVFGIFLYYATRPISRRLDRYVDNSDATAALTLLAVGLPMLLVVGYGLFQGLGELNQFLASNDLGRYRSYLRPHVDLARISNLQRLSERIQQGRSGPLGPVSWTAIRRYLSALLRYASVIFGVLLDAFVMLLVAFYLLQADDAVGRWFRRTFERERSVVAFAESVDADLERIYWGNLVVVGITALIAGVTYYGLRSISPQGVTVPYVVLSAALTGIFTLVPVVGIKLFYFPMTGYLLLVAVTREAAPLWFPVAFFLVTLVVVDTVPDFFIRSYVSSGDIHAGLVLMSYVFGSVAFGWYGIFLGPIVLVLFLHFARTILPMLLRGVPVESRAE
ncbi:AI-2E family transporter [Halegenticoccus soli]|uniref:AI-2E family transporter n=1 Tax=Halegenticoccus soli TaxID=1985678 RepID=UPI000C6E6449|nr:AI-2E family transporter [Halegenticoccus soli]